MKKTIKRIFAWMIVLTLVFSVFPAAAFAEESIEEIGHQHEKVVEEIPGEGTEPSQEPAQEEELPAAEEEELSEEIAPAAAVITAAEGVTAVALLGVIISDARVLLWYRRKVKQVKEMMQHGVVSSDL